MHLTRYWGIRIAACTAIACFTASAAMAQDKAGPPAAVQNCESCHGPGGDSKVTTTPRLNGQQAEYITSRLKVLATATSSPHAQTGMFKTLPAQNDIAKIAQYFAGQSPTSPKPGARAADGKLIYEKGQAADNVIACSQCHGANGEGHDTTPRIAGQHGDYLKAQIRLFSMKFREHVLMHPNTKTMRADTVEALIAYLAND